MSMKSCQVLNAFNSLDHSISSQREKDEKKNEKKRVWNGDKEKRVDAQSSKDAFAI